MDSEKCRVLLKAIQLGSLTEAASQLGYTTSGVSRMMAALEEEIGFVLLARSRGGVVPTPECNRLLPALHQLIYAQDCLRQTADDILGLETGSVTVGTAYIEYYGWLSGIISDFRCQHPNIEVAFLQGNSTRLFDAVSQLQADFAIISQRAGCDNWISLCPDQMVACIPFSHPLAQADRYPIKRFEKDPFIDIFPDEETDSSRCIARCHIRPNIQFTASEDAGAQAMVAAGLGVCLNNAIVAKRFASHMAVLPLDPPQPNEIGLLYSSAETLSPAAIKFLQFIKAHLADEGLPKSDFL